MKWIVSLCVLMLALVLVYETTSQAEHDQYVGAETCGQCHTAIYEAWKSGPHGMASERLDVNQRKDSKCLRCHGRTLAGGMAGVQCEFCHGPGQHYAKEFVMRDLPVAKAVGLVIDSRSECVSCHNADSPAMREFDPHKAWKRLPHAKHVDKH